MPLRKGVHGTRRRTTLLRNSSGCYVKEDFTPELRWVCSEANWAADSVTKPERTEHDRLSQAAFDRLWGTWGGGGDMDLMATDTSAQYTPTEGGWERQKLLLPAFSYKQHSWDRCVQS